MFNRPKRLHSAGLVSEKVLLCAFLCAAPCLAGGREATRVADELHEEFVKGFNLLDEDGDGAVDFTALVRALKAVGYGQAAAVQRGRGGGDPERIFDAFDADGDGVLSGKEAGPFLRESKYFADGEVTLAEYRLASRELAQRRGNRGGRGGGQRGGGSAQTSDMEFLASIDGNGDRMLTREEAREAIEREVRENMESRTSLDGDGDGAVSAREYSLSQAIRGETDADGLDGHARGHFRREDFDGDGGISAAEIGERVLVALRRRHRAMQLSLRLLALDANADGSLQDSELGGLAESGALPAEVGKLYAALYPLAPERTRPLERLLGE